MKLIASLVLVGTLSLFPAITGCKGANFPVIDNVAKIVLTDLLAGDGITQIEADVKAVSPAGADVIAFTDDALQVLADFGLIPANVLPAAQTMHVTLASQRGVAAPMVLKGFAATATAP